MPVRIQTKDFDAGAEVAALRRDNPKVGAVASFIGVCRDANDGGAVTKMTLEHYPGMTEKALDKIVSEAKSRWEGMDVLVVNDLIERLLRSEEHTSELQSQSNLVCRLLL